MTEVTPRRPFHMAEDDHQEYFQRVGGGNPYCSFVIEPKVAKFRKLFVERLKRPVCSRLARRWSRADDGMRAFRRRERQHQALRDRWATPRRMPPSTSA